MRAQQLRPAIVPDGQGGAVIAWEDLRFQTGWSIFAVRITPSDSIATGWPDSGLAVAGSSFGIDPAMAADGTGGAFLTWAIGGGTVTMQHALANGTMATALPQLAATRSATGLAGRIEEVGGDGAKKFEPESYGPVLLPDGQGGTYVGWGTGSLRGSTVLLQDVTATGHAAADWPAPVLVQATFASTGSVVLCADASGGAYIGWIVYSGTSDHLAVQHYGANGTLATGWPTGPVFACPAGGPQASPGLVPDGAGGVIAFWNDAHEGSFSQLYAMRLMPDSSRAPGWPSDGLPVCTFPTLPGARRGEEVGLEYQSAISDDNGGAFIAWTDLRADSGDVYMQHILPDGSHSASWPDNGLPVCTAPGPQSFPALAPDGEGGALVVWQDERWASRPDVFAQRITAAGAIASGWPVNGLSICVALGRQARPVIASDGAHGAFIAWEDSRDSLAAIYASHVTGDAIVPVEVSLISSEAGPGFVRLIWDAEVVRDQVVTVERRTESSLWESKAALVPDGSGHVTYEDRAVAPGTRYGYRLKYGRSGGDSFTPETWVDVPSLVVALTLDPPRPNPAAGAMRISFSLPSGARATLTILDVTGRIVSEREVGSLGAGRHEVDVAEGRHLAPGLYLVTLRQGPAVRVIRAALLD